MFNLFPNLSLPPKEESSRRADEKGVTLALKIESTKDTSNIF